MAGPSAIGSENGTPISRMSLPASTMPWRIGTVLAFSGSPAVTKGISALRPAAFSSAKRPAMRDIRA